VKPLAPLEARVLGVLVEKQATVPDTYPLSLNALLAGCNQKTARDPVMNATEADALTAIDELKARSLVFEVSGSRVVRFEHNLGRVLGVPGQSVALLATLVLRGAQTAAELRLHSDRLHRFADVSSVEAFLDELAAKDPPLVARLPRAPGERESRWVHLLCGEAAAAPPPAPFAAIGSATGELDAIKAEQARLAGEVEQLKALVRRLAAAVGVETEPSDRP
jgi:uncharacterized protein YceH (UPF0502 family)